MTQKSENIRDSNDETADQISKGDSDKSQAKGFTLRQIKLQLFEEDIENLELQSFVLPRNISSQLGIEPDPSYLISPSKRKSNPVAQQDERLNSSQDSNEDLVDLMSFQKMARFFKFQKKIKLTSGYTSKLGILRNVRTQKSKKLRTFQESFLKKNQSHLQSFKSRDFTGDTIGTKKFVAQRIKFLNTTKPLEGPNSIPPRSTPTICQEHSKVNFARIKNLRVDGDL
jgi:hypothetical protein